MLAKAFLRSRQWRGCAKAHSGDSRKTATARLLAHYTMKQKCLLAKAFLRSRQWRGCAKAHSGDSRKTAIAGFCAHYTINL
ncbi:MAG TPA: hypothetical protein DD628_06845 [Clostridiales bacterium]|nr:hypothetical protein [Candidatus Apopatosoma intestinale]